MREQWSNERFVKLSEAQLDTEFSEVLSYALANVKPPEAERALVDWGRLYVPMEEAIEMKRKIESGDQQSYSIDAAAAAEIVSARSKIVDGQDGS